MEPLSASKRTAEVDGGHTALPMPDYEEVKPVLPAWRRGVWAYILNETLLDLVLVVGCLVLWAGLELVTPRHGFAVKATLFQYHTYPHLENTVPTWTVPVYSILGPLLVFFVYKFVSGRSWSEVTRLSVVFLLAVFLVGAITNCLKVPIGRFRPNFVAICWNGSTPVFRNENAYGGYPVCSCSESDSNEIRKSFPSGHSSISAAGLGFLTYWLLGQFKSFAGRGYSWSFAVALLPGFGAIVVGVTRVIDYWHFPSDVLTGLAIGFLTSFFVYRLMYPPLTHPLCCTPTYLHATAPAKRSAPFGPSPVLASSPA